MEELEEEFEEEYLTFHSPNWNGELLNGAIVDEGTQGWCISFLGNQSVIHEGEEVEIASVRSAASDPIKLKYVDRVQFIN